MYEAIVVKIDNIENHPNADRLKIATINGFKVVVGLDTNINDVGLFFSSDGQISEEYAIANSLISYIDPITKERRGGFFPKNRRVRAQSFRGVKSDGYFAPLDSLNFTGGDISTLSVGSRLSEFNGVKICNKYYTPATLKAMKGGTKTSQKKENKMFAKHVDTEQFRFVDNIPKHSVVYLTEKLHGTSGRYGYVSDEVCGRRSIFDRILRRKPRVVQTYTHLQGTRNVVMGDNHTGFYGNEQFRYDAVANLEGRLHKGEVLYYELVGFTTDGKSIMPAANTKDLKDKEISKQYGPQMLYKYGCGANECRLYVYRITQVNEDGHAVELSWPQVKKRCRELELNYVPELHSALIVDMDTYDAPNFDDLKMLVAGLEDGPSTLDNSHIREGVVLRVESEYGTGFFKSKSYDFKVLEQIIKEKDDYVDMEEAS